MDTNDLFSDDLSVINVGIRTFYEDLKKNGVRVIQVNFQPPADGDEKLISLIDRIRQK